MGTKERQEENTLWVLDWISRFGWLTRSQIGRLIWPSSSESVRRKMATKTLKRCSDAGWIMARRLPTGSVCYVLRPAGVAYFTSDKPDRLARSGLDLALAQPLHRMLANNVMIEHNAHGFNIITEYEILGNRLPKMTISEKAPDGLIVDMEGAVTWLEFENHARKRRDFDRLISLITGPLRAASASGYQLLDDLYLTGLILAFPNERLGAGLTRRLLSVAQAQEWPDSLRDSIELLWAKQTPQGRWLGLERRGTLAYPPDAWTANSRKTTLEKLLEDQAARIRELERR